MEARSEKSIMEQIMWYLERLNEKQLKRVLLCAFRLFVGKEV